MDKIPPQNTEAEQSVLGSILRDPDALHKVIELISPPDFYRDPNSVIYQTILDLFNNNHPTDLITVTEELRKKGLIEQVGGYAAVAQLANMVPTSANVEYYARIVKDKSLTRKVISNANLILETAYAGEYETSEELVGFAESAMFQLGQKLVRNSLTHARDLVYNQLDTIQARDVKKGVTGISTTFGILDIWTAGWQRGELIVIAARPSMGKTSWAFQMAKDTAIRCGNKTAIFSLEVNKESAIEKMLVNEAMVDGQRVRIGKLDSEEGDRLINAADRIAKANIFIDDTAAITVPEIRSKCRKIKCETGLDMVVIDYLQLMNSHKKTENRQREVSEITRSLKLMARELDVPVLVLSQLTREVMKSNDKRPNLGHLKDSGSIEADADVVVFLHRDEYYNQDSEKKGITEIIVAKQRNGPVGTIELAFRKEYTRFAMLDTHHQAAMMGKEVKGGWIPDD